MLSRVSDVSFQVHSVPATNEHTLRSIELLATEVAPALGLQVEGTAGAAGSGAGGGIGGVGGVGAAAAGSAR